MKHQASVLVIFEHELLGEGLAARLAGMGVTTLTANSCDSSAVEAALRTHPDVVVVECHNEGCVARVRTVSPDSRVVDATAAIGRGYPTEAMRFDVIVEALKGQGPRQTPA